MLPLGLMKPAKGANADFHGPSDGSTFHDLDKLFPHAPIPVDGGVILRNATIDGPDGLPEVLDWVSQGDIVILDVAPVMENESRIKEIIDPLMLMLENQVGGEILNFGKSRLLLLPPNVTIDSGDGA